jgi:hypothetical protein
MEKGNENPFLVNIGFGNLIATERVISILTSASSPMKRLKSEAKDSGKLIDATEGRRTRSIIIMDSGHVILSALQTETLANRFYTEKGEE